MSEHKEKVCSASFLHEELGIPHQYLRQLLTNLSKSGFIEGTRGREGGFKLSKNIGDIYLADIIDSIEGLDVFNICIMGFRECPFEKQCAMHETWIEIRGKIIDMLRKTSLENFIID